MVNVVLGTYLLGLLGHIGESATLKNPVVIRLGALRGLALLGVATVTGGSGELLHGGGKVVELGLKLLAITSLVNTAVDVTTLDLDDTEIVGLHGVLVHETTRVDVGHVLVHEGLDLAKVARVVDAAVLGEEDGKAIAGEVLHLLVPAGGDEVRGAPRVVVLPRTG